MVLRESDMKTRRKIVNLQLSIALSALIAGSPYTVKYSSSNFTVALHAAFAKNGDNGNSNGRGGANSNGNSGGNGNASGGKNETRGNQGARGNSETKRGAEGGFSVRHEDGISELVRNGRYIMRDSKGRTIVDRRSTFADELRLRFLRR